MKIGDGKRKNSFFTIAIKYSYHIFLLVVSILLFACSTDNTQESMTGMTMGTWYNIKYISTLDKQPDKNWIKTGIDSVLNVVNGQMSTYDKDSEISQFNIRKDTTWFSVSPDFANVVSIAQLISEQSDGAFDITVGPLVNLWGFGPGNQPQKVPSDLEIEAVRKNIGYKYLQVRLNPPALKKEIPGLYLDLSAIAKGYGVDRVADFLKEKNIYNFMVEIGGEVATGGMNGDNPWRIGIQTPDEKAGIEAVINLTGESIATSGDYHNYFEDNGIRYSHTIDPKTGKPVTHKLASISIIYPNCTGADAYATAIDVLGPERGLKFAKKQKLHAFFIVKDNEKFTEVITDGFKKYISRLQRD